MTSRFPFPVSRFPALVLVFALATPAPAPPPGPLAFPRDHGSHPSAAIEWWYYTGNLADAAGHAYGFQLTFFRVGDFALAHGAWTDGARKTFDFREKAHLTLPGIAEFAEGRLEVSNEDWSASERAGIHRLRLRWENRTLDLDLTASKPPVLQGEKGLSRKGPGEGEYSHYVSISRLSAAGALVENGRRTPLSGAAWFDHEWGPGALPQGAAGWDWFALQLDDGSELMLYRIRTKEGRATPFSSGVFVPPTGPTVPLRFDEVRFRSTREWRSPRSGGVYPAAWEVAIPRLALELTVQPLVADQELVTGRSTGVTYWEGACRAAGRRGGRPVSARGYAELTGYAGRDVPGFSGR
ncbi:MAG: carotenoid 1,2-hydratase [Acidobacteria bacterium]|nr:carotenoid 1,2-hydratase [Acidobacteriota bacterium]MCA1611226.1 carotenoid 1,2-hydratase [Acidobacteriota bacterium]